MSQVGEIVQYAYRDTHFVPSDGVHHVVIGPFDTREEAVEAASRDPHGGSVVEYVPGPYRKGFPCPDCGSTLERLPMSAAAGNVYDALFPSVLDWSEADDCGMAELMRSVAEAAADALGADINRPE